jgi:phosphinothricin acetyltransferase
MPFSKDIRRATVADAPGIAEIYSYYVNNTVITFELVPPDLAETEKRIAECLNSSYEWIVHENGGKILGFAYYSAFKERKAYDYTCETTVYVHHDFLGKGIGSALYSRLIEELKKSKMAVALACIAIPNDESVGLHEKLGFKSCGIIKNAGRKFNRWVDIGYWRLELKNLPEYEPEKKAAAYQGNDDTSQT